LFTIDNDYYFPLGGYALGQPVDLLGLLAMLQNDRQCGFNLINKSLIPLTGFGLIDTIFGLSFFWDFGPSFNLWFFGLWLCGLWFRMVCLTSYGFVCMVCFVWLVFCAFGFA